MHSVMLTVGRISRFLMGLKQYEGTPMAQWLDCYAANYRSELETAHICICGMVSLAIAHTTICPRYRYD